MSGDDHSPPHNLYFIHFAIFTQSSIILVKNPVTFERVMEAAGSSKTASGRGFARFACDFCRVKKLKCSREIPKCSGCKPWPSSCVYSREVSSFNANGKRLHVAEASSKDTKTSIESRLERLERIIQSLTSSVEEALRVLSVAAPRRDLSKIPITSNQTIANEADRSDSELYIGPSHSFSFLQEAPAGIERLARQGVEDSRQCAISEIHNMSSSLTSARIGNPTKASTGFHVPSRSAGYALLGKFLEHCELGEPFFRFPSDEVLRQIVFEPEKVREKAWIVSFNYILLAAISTQQDEHEDKLRQNSQLALNDSQIFLEPSLANVQTLALLAVHGEDFASPNISWMLLSHACRQAEALGLHIKTSKGRSDESQHKLCLFWMLFTLDKSCALAFGRPAFLPFSLYRYVPLPDEEFMRKFSPHDTEAPCSQQQKSQNSGFGALLFKNTVELAKLMSDVLDVLGVSNSEKSKDETRSKLEGWFSIANMTLTQAMENERISADADQIHEMKLGINSVKFQYLHILTLLLKSDRTSDLRLSFAREAISLLPSLVSNWGSVYNGVVWQLLYYPFAPFFVIFENLVHQHSHYPKHDEDLRLLATTVNYFAEMRSQMRLLAGLCYKLQHTAAVFLQLAQSHTRHGNSTKPAGNTAPLSQQQKSSALGEKATQPWDDLINIDLGDHDFSTYLNWLPVDMNATSRILETELQGPKSHHPDRSQESSLPYPQKPMSDRTFDWFLWDDYYGSTNVGFE
ncbi:hypothetical protein N7509_014127 [Penicillium cosmopolitanum]|uniref:Zn(2)-C6 fungal-type domain-containing protein n=1 Tax=Penicillium cosmopolitanum TaxID=1131564 RepID=A0A9W9S088_9EURO|nr:uncharacterized protein N7509_014127 [Penicillium cosmopolitanum]KAJ5369515.1 hypothetical protein N7509_014127 [Penicillium cosmopolitanum]